MSYQHSQLRSLKNQHNWWTIRLVHTSTVSSQHLHLGIGQVVQIPPLTDKYIQLIHIFLWFYAEKRDRLNVQKGQGKVENHLRD